MNVDVWPLIPRDFSHDIVVLGDTIIDEYEFGRVTGVCQALSCLKWEQYASAPARIFPGGAAHIAHQAAVLGGNVTLITALDSSPHAMRVAQTLTMAGVRVVNVANENSPATNTRILRTVDMTQPTAPRVLLRRDTVGCPEQGTMAVLRELAALEDSDAVYVVANYGKGLLDDDWAKVFSAALRNKCVLVNGRAPYDWQLANSIVVSNGSEYARMMSILGSYYSPHSALQTAQLAQVTGIIRTDGYAGVQAALRESVDVFCDVPTGGHVVDTTGAGDTFMATLALVAAHYHHLDGDNFEKAIEVATMVASLSTERVGSDVVPLGDIFTRATPAPIIGAYETVESRFWRVLRRTTELVFTNGCFDVLHAGHLHFLQHAAELGTLVVAVNSDVSTRLVKGQDRPVQSWNTRAHALACLPYVGLVLEMAEPTPVALLNIVQPDLLVKGGTTDKIVGEDAVASWGGRAQLLGSVLPGFSTTNIVTAVKENERGASDKG